MYTEYLVAQAERSDDAYGRQERYEMERSRHPEYYQAEIKYEAHLKELETNKVAENKIFSVADAEERN